MLVPLVCWRPTSLIKGSKLLLARNHGETIVVVISSFLCYGLLSWPPIFLYVQGTTEDLWEEWGPFEKLSSILYSNSLASANTNTLSCPHSCHKDFSVGCHSFCTFKVLFMVCGKSEGQICLKFVKFSSILSSAVLTSVPLPSTAAITTQWIATTLVLSLTYRCLSFCCNRQCSFLRKVLV
jgi:hypothetical protein